MGTRNLYSILHEGGKVHVNTGAAPLIPDIMSMNHMQPFQVDQPAAQNAPRNKNTEYWPNSTAYGPLHEGSN
jgi:hypothetical protein